MTEKNTEPHYYDVVIYNDNKTPFDFIARLIRHVMGMSQYDAEEKARRIDRSGRHLFGPYPEPIARAVVEEANRMISAAG